MKKRGLSAVITTLMIILLVIVAIGIIWVVIRNVISEGTEQITLSSFTLDLKIKESTIEGNILKVGVKRNIGEGDLSAIKFIFSDGQNTEIIQIETNMNELAEKTFSFDLGAFEDISFIKGVSIAPVFKSESGKERLGRVIDEKVSSYTESCKRILDEGDSIGDGIYKIDPNGVVKGGTIDVYCDMTLDNGGWTLIGRSHLSCSGDFGWKSSTGSITDDSQCYSMNIDEKGIAFSEISFGDYSTEKNWGNNVYKHTSIPSDFLDFYNNTPTNDTHATESGFPKAPNQLIGSCNPFSMWQYLGYTYRTDSFWARDVPPNSGYGLRKSTGFNSANYVCAGSGGGVDDLHGMIFIR